MSNEFLQPRFVGPRFDQKMLPIEVARDLAAYEELIIELAKQLYLEDHRYRVRVPKGFADAFSLNLERIDDGSTRPLLSWVTAAAIALIPLQGSTGESNYFTAARDLVADCIRANAGGFRPPKRFPKPLFEYFNALGRSLRDGESVDLAPPNTEAAVLTPERRKALILEAGRQFYTKEIYLSGVVGEADSEKDRFRLRLADGTAVTVHLPGFYHNEVRAAWAKQRTQVLVKGIGIFDAADRLKEVAETLQLETLPNQELAVRIENLSSLSDGWLGDGTKALDKTALAWAKDQLTETFPDDLPFPVLAPTPEGGLFLEWVQSTLRISAEVVLPAHRVELLSVNVETGAAEDSELDLDADPSWPAMYDFVRQRL